MACRQTTVPERNKKKTMKNTIREHNAAVLCIAQLAEEDEESRVETKDKDLSYVDVRIVLFILFTVFNKVWSGFPLQLQKELHKYKSKYSEAIQHVKALSEEVKKLKRKLERQQMRSKEMDFQNWMHEFDKNDLRIILSMSNNQKLDRLFAKKILRGLFKEARQLSDKTIKGKGENSDAFCPHKVQVMREAFAYHLKDTGRYNESYFTSVFSKGLSDIKLLLKQKHQE